MHASVTIPTVVVQDEHIPSESCKCSVAAHRIFCVERFWLFCHDIICAYSCDYFALFQIIHSDSFDSESNAFDSVKSCLLFTSIHMLSVRSLVHREPIHNKIVNECQNQMANDQIYCLNVSIALSCARALVLANHCDRCVCVDGQPWISHPSTLGPNRWVADAHAMHGLIGDYRLCVWICIRSVHKLVMKRK